MRPPLSARTMVAGVAGAPIAHSLSPLIHNAWLDAAGLDGVYVAFAPPPAGFTAFAQAFRGGAIRGLNITAPFKQEALALADRATPRASRAGSANLLLFEADGQIAADNTDGEGLMSAFSEQAPDFLPTAGPVAILGAGGAARGAAAALLEAGTPAIRIIARAAAKAEALRALWGDRLETYPFERMAEALEGVAAIVNATPLGRGNEPPPPAALEGLAASAVVMDMVYQPVRTALLVRAATLGLTTVDGLAMLIGQAAPSFRRLFGRTPPATDVRALALASLGEGQ